jgi:hypothetical protein
VRFIVRHAVALGVVVCSLGATAGVFAFARPEHRPPYESKTIGAIEASVSALSRAEPFQPRPSWPEATNACESMQARISAFGWKYWKPLSTGRPLAKVAALRQEDLLIHEAGLRQMRAHTHAQARALYLYRNMLSDMRRVISAAERRDVSSYTSANVRLVLSISATRLAFKRAGAARICEFAI